MTENHDIERNEQEIKSLFEETAQHASQAELNSYARYSANVPEHRPGIWRFASWSANPLPMTIGALLVVAAVTVWVNNSSDQTNAPAAATDNTATGIAVSAPERMESIADAERTRKAPSPAMGERATSNGMAGAATLSRADDSDFTEEIILTGAYPVDDDDFAGLYGIDVAALSEHELNNVLGAYDEVIASL